MQTIITETLDFGIPGEFASTNPRVLDLPYQVGVALTLGDVVAVKGNLAAPVGTATYTAKKGIAVSPHQHINRGSSGNALASTMILAAGDELAIATKGDVYVECIVDVTAPTDTTKGYATKDAAEAAGKAAVEKAIADAVEAVTRNTALYYNSTGKVTTDTSGTALGYVRDCGKRITTAAVSTVTGSQTSGQSTYEWAASFTSLPKIVVALTIG